MKRICSAGLAALAAVSLLGPAPVSAEVIREIPAKEVSTVGHGQPVAMADLPKVAAPYRFAWQASLAATRRAEPAPPFNSLTWARAMPPIDFRAAAADTLARVLDPFTLLAEPSPTGGYGIMALERDPVVSQGAARAARSSR